MEIIMNVRKHAGIFIALVNFLLFILLIMAVVFSFSSYCLGHDATEIQISHLRICFLS